MNRSACIKHTFRFLLHDIALKIDGRDGWILRVPIYVCASASVFPNGFPCSCQPAREQPGEAEEREPWLGAGYERARHVCRLDAMFCWIRTPQFRISSVINTA